MNVDGVPASKAEGTFKEKMETGFLCPNRTQDTIIIIKVHVFSSKNISSTLSVLDQQPCKKFMFTKISRFPNPLEEWGGLNYSL